MLFCYTKKGLRVYKYVSRGITKNYYNRRQKNWGYLSFPFSFSIWRKKPKSAFPSPLTQLILRRTVLIQIQWYNYSCRILITLWKLDIYVSINLRKINAKSISADFSAHAPFMRLCARIANKMPRAIFYAHNPPLF